MKDISEYTLKECLEEVEMLDSIYEQTRPVKLAERISELTRWNNIDDSLPPKGVLFETCGVESGTYWRYYTAPPSPAVDALYVSEDKP
jgi:hypothetical protein